MMLAFYFHHMRETYCGADGRVLRRSRRCGPFYAPPYSDRYLLGKPALAPLELQEPMHHFPMIATVVAVGTEGTDDREVVIHLGTD